MQLPHRYLQHVLSRILPLLDSLSVKSTYYRTNINVSRQLFAGLCWREKHWEPYVLNRSMAELLLEELHILKIFIKKVHDLPIHRCNLS